MYSDEEKGAVERLSLKAITSSIDDSDYPNTIVIKKDLTIALNLIEKLTKIINEMKEWIENEQNNKVDGQYTSGSYMLTAEEIMQYFENAIREDK